MQDDLYALGVTIAVMMRHFDPLENLSDNEIIERKMDEGSYVALLARDRFSGAILELLRGLLQDNEDQRWTLDEVLQWMDGRRLSPKQAVRRSKANRPLHFNGEKYIRPELLARDLGKNVNEARQLIETGEIEQWLSRALENKLMTARYEKALEQAEEGGKGGAGYVDRLVTRVAIALHPEGPMRFKSINTLPDGVGVSLYEAFIMKRDLQTYIDFFMGYFITQWVDQQSSPVPDVSSLVSKFDGARAFLRQKGLGNGLERCIYALNAEAPCLSEKLQKYYVRTPEEMMRAFEKMSSQPSRPAMFFDRHSVAFLSVKDRKNIDPYMHDLNAPEQYRRVLAEVKILATIQKRSAMEKFPGIAKWMLENLEPVYERFHDRELRAEIKKKADRLQETGDLPKIVLLFDDPLIYQEDNTNFRKAMRKYHELETETLDTERELGDEAQFGKDTGHQVAAIVGALVALIAVMFAGFSAFG
jgi:eukaryotic-like serine/threonine-protein kinase